MTTNIKHQQKDATDNRKIIHGVSIIVCHRITWVYGWQASDKWMKIVTRKLVNSSEMMVVTVEATTAMVATVLHPQWPPDGTSPRPYAPRWLQPSASATVRASSTHGQHSVCLPSRSPASTLRCRKPLAGTNKGPSEQETQRKTREKQVHVTYDPQHKTTNLYKNEVDLKKRPNFP